MTEQKKRFKDWYRSRTLDQIYTDYLNNFLTVAGMADHYGINVDDMKYAIDTAKNNHREQQEWKSKAKRFNNTGSYY